MECTICNILYGTVGVIVFVLLMGWWMNGHFRRLGVKSPLALFPIIGHMTYARTTTFKDFIKNLYNAYPEERYTGIIQFGKPLIILNDLELIKQIGVKDFDHFINHSATLDAECDPIFGNGIFSLKGQKWRDMRSTLSPAFTSSKMRGMFPLVVECGEQMVEFYKSKMAENEVRGLIELELKDMFTRYGNDAIASVAFGLKVDSFAEANNTFYTMGRTLTNLTGMQYFKFIFFILLPKLCKTLGMTFLADDIVDFFRNLVWDTVEYREKNNVVRNDMIQIIMETRAGTLKHDSSSSAEQGNEAGFATVEEYSHSKDEMRRIWSDDEFVAQAVTFIFGGIDTSATVLCFLFHELATHPEIQRKLQEEIDKKAAGLEGKLTYDCLQNMKYLDMVVCETLRIWPPAAALDRMCTKAYLLPPPRKDGVPYLVKEGNGVAVPVQGIHFDPKYWPDPEVFNPERFSDENKDKIIPYTYMPFGVGPRNCIGSRFALMKVKSAVYHLLLNFDVVTTAKTQNPVKINNYSFNLQAIGGVWVGLKPRTKIN